MARIVALGTSDVRFPTSLSLDGSDAMNPDPDCSTVHVRIRDEALDILRAAEPGRDGCAVALLADGHPAYTTTPRRLGYDDAMLARLCREAVADGFTQITLEVGANLAEDIRRLGIAREVCGPDIRIALDANQRRRAVSVGTTDRMIELVDHLHEHFVTPVDVVGGKHRAPTAPGAGAQLLDRSIVEYTRG